MSWQSAVVRYDDGVKVHTAEHAEVNWGEAFGTDAPIQNHGLLHFREFVVGRGYKHTWIPTGQLRGISYLKSREEEK